MQIKILVFLLVINLFTACIEEFSPKIDDYMNLPVVEGTITNEPGPYTVRLSKSLPVYSLDYVPITGANIVISDDLNTEELLVEIEPGIYSTDSLATRGEIGRKYRLTIGIGNKTYQSSYEELEEPFEIDSIYGKVAYQETREGYFEGLQFYINTKAPNDKNRYFLWIPVETYKYQADIKLDYIYYDYEDIVQLHSNDTISICWRTNKRSEIFTFSTTNLNAANINNFPLHYVSTATKKLFKKYSLLVNQYSITEKAYRYWTMVKVQNSESGSFYSTQPFQIRGNLANIDNPNDIILGYFMAAGVSKKRIFVDKPQLKFNFPICKASVEAFEAIFKYPNPNFPAYIANTNEGLARAYLRCFDCRLHGGTTTKPDFWED